MKHFYSPTQGYCVFDEAPIPLGDWVEVLERPGPDYVWGGSEWAAPAPSVPESVTPWQAREALRLAGILGAVNSYIDALGDASAAYVAWHYAERIRRNSPFFEAIGPALGLTEAQIDALFIQASGLSL